MNTILYNAIIGFVVGDAVGVPYEFKTRGLFECTDMRASTDADFHFSLPLGAWSDDTSLMLCVLDALAHFPNKNEMYQCFKKDAVDWVKKGKFTNHGGRGPFDIGNSCRRGIIELQTGRRNTTADLESSNGNGGLMRIPPLTFMRIKDDDALMEYIKLFNQCSHNHIISHIGCLIYIRIAENLLNGYKMREAFTSAVARINDKYKIPEYRRIWDLTLLDAPIETIKSSGYVIDTLEAAIWCCANASTYRQAVLDAVNLGDDTDTVAALTGFLAGLDQMDIPDDWENAIPEKSLIMKLCKHVKETSSW